MSAAAPLPEPPPAAAGRRALLLDFDGTLADSLGFLRAVYDGFVSSLGGEPSGDEFEALNGPPVAEIVDRLCRRHSAAGGSREDVRRYEAMIDRRFAALPMMRGAPALLKSAARLGMTSTVVTSNARGRVELWLASRGLDGLCSVIVAGDDAVAAKPSPEPYHLALRRLGIAASQALAVEDSEAGARAAALAGIETMKLGAALEAPCGTVHGVRDLREARRLLVRIAAQ